MRRPRQRRFGIKSFRKIFPILILIAAFVFLYIVLRIYTAKSVWDQQSKFAIIVPLQNEDVELVVLDPSSQSLVKLTIPKNTLVDAANQLGNYQIGSIYQLGQHQGLGGRLLKDTVQKSFHLSVDAWAEPQVLDLVSPNPLDLVKGILYSFDTDLSIKDKIKLVLYSINARGINRMSINLADTSNLVPTKLIDGEDGFIAKKDLSSQVLAYFTDSSIAEKNPRIQILNFSDSTEIAQDIGKTIEVLGGSVMSILNNETNLDLDCEVKGEDSQLVERMAYAFGCRAIKQSTQSNFDLIISLGQKFIQRY